MKAWSNLKEFQSLVGKLKPQKPNPNTFTFLTLIDMACFHAIHFSSDERHGHHRLDMQRVGDLLQDLFLSDGHSE